VEMQPPGEDEQTRLWNGPAGRAWVDAREVLDQMFKPFEALLVDAVLAGPGGQVLDVGCGTGSTTLAVARVLGAKGGSVGIDTSAPMIVTARARAASASAPPAFICADAQAYAFEPARFDMIISRFGVMFFEDAVQAFANLRRAAKSGAGLRFIAWRSAAENPFMTVAEHAAGPLLANLPARRVDAPGQFAFADRQRISSILGESGWADIEIRPIDVVCALPESMLNQYLTRLGPVGLAMEQVDVGTRVRVAEAVRAAFDPYVHGAEVRFTAACWMVGAGAPAGTAVPKVAMST
jgi:ubiquinone/menaquinone biosynthesis C-methylase UbiE